MTEGNAGSTAVVLTVTLTGERGRDVVIPYATVDGTAQAPGDYSSATGSLTFAPADTSKTVTVNVVGDTAFEPDESFSLRLNATPTAQIADDIALVTITNDDAAPPPPPPPPPPPVTPPDTTAPATTLTGGPKGTIRSRTARFTFRSNEAGSRFQCKLDKGAWKACSSPKTYRNLKKGSHTFQVRAIDRAGNLDRTPSKRAWRIR